MVNSFLPDLFPLNFDVDWGRNSTVLLIYKFRLLHTASWALNIFVALLKANRLVPPGTTHLHIHKRDHGTDKHTKEIGNHTSRNTKENWHKYSKHNAANSTNNLAELVVTVMTMATVVHMVMWATVVTAGHRWAINTVMVATWAVVHVVWWWAVDAMRTHAHTLAFAAVAAMQPYTLEAVELVGDDGAPLAEERPVMAFLEFAVGALLGLNPHEHELALCVFESDDCDFGD